MIRSKYSENKIVKCPKNIRSILRQFQERENKQKHGAVVGWLEFLSKLNYYLFGAEYFKIISRSIGKDGGKINQHHQREKKEGNNERNDKITAGIDGFAGWSFGQNLQLFVKSRHPLWSFPGLQNVLWNLPRWILGSSRRFVHLWRQGMFLPFEGNNFFSR